LFPNVHVIVRVGVIVNADVNVLDIARAHAPANVNVIANVPRQQAAGITGSTAMKTIAVNATFIGKGYIANPYWTEMAKLIDIQKSSGLNRAKSDAARRKSLEEYLRNNNMKLDEYEDLIKLANRPFHKSEDGEIVIPADRVLSFLVNCCLEVRAAGRPCPPDQMRSLVEATDWTTGKREPDGIWERFALVKSGTGAKLSNQRGLRRSPYITGFTATGQLTVDDQYVKPEVLSNLVKWGGMQIGIGASRKMGYGRFTATTNI